MEKFKEKQPDRASESHIHIVDNAIERMKTGAVVKEERTHRFKFVFFAAIGIAALAAFSSLDFVYQKPSSETAPNGDIVVTLKRGEKGHYFTTGEVNGESVKFIVDTGASSVVIPMHVAKKIGLPLGRKITTSTGNGYGTAYISAIKSFALGDIKMNNIDATVTEGLTGDEGLLGMTFLKHTKIEHDKGIMTITY